MGFSIVVSLDARAVRARRNPSLAHVARPGARVAVRRCVPKNRPVTTVLLERDGELETLRAALEGGGRLVLVSGEAGVGKSSLAGRFCEEHADDARVLVGACDALQTPRPLGPFLDLAAGGARHVEAALEHAAKPYAIYAALAEELRAARGRSIVLLEDLHWADDATLDVVRLLARRIRTLPALVLATFRDDELAATTRSASCSASSRRARRHRLHLAPLSEAAVASSPASTRSTRRRSTGGRPATRSSSARCSRAAARTCRRRCATPSWPGRPGREGPREVLERVAVVPHRAELWLLDALGSAHMARSTPASTPGCCGPTATPWRSGTSWPGGRSRSRSGPAGGCSCTAGCSRPCSGGAAGAPDLARLAHHAEGAGDAAQVLRYSSAAAERAEELGAHREAAAQWARALRFAGGLPAAGTAVLSRGTPRRAT